MMLPRSYVDWLLRAALNGDRSEFDRLFDAGFHLVWRAARHRSPERAHELTADVIRRSLLERLDELLAGEAGLALGALDAPHSPPPPKELQP
jgi:hypothetical protein